MKDLLIKVGIAILIALAYFQIWRPLRGYVAQNVVKPVCEYVISSDRSDIIFKEARTGVSFHIYYNVNSESPQQFLYKTPGGFFFLVALVSLVFITRQSRYYLYLVGFHLAAFLITFLLMIVGCTVSTTAFSFVDFLRSYLIPVLSMAYIPWLIFYLKTQDTE